MKEKILDYEIETVLENGVTIEERSLKEKILDYEIETVVQSEGYTETVKLEREDTRLRD